jgi:Antibiotic biosynthesis monooxygenase
MAVSRTHRYSVDPGDLEEFLARRAAVIDAIRAAHPGLSEARLTRLEDGTFTDVWRWDSAEQMQAAAADMARFPQARDAMALTKDRTALDGEIIDER